ncbi:MAG: YfhO family protein [Eubacteriales bacterium]|nr:YfhO family protein [Eubacteriales bacterium]
MIKTDKPKLLLYTAAFFIPFIIMTIIYAAAGIYPFGDKSVLMLDGYGQYIDFIAACRRMITEGSSFLYSFSKGLGDNMVGLFAYYLASPLLPLILLFPAKNITEGVLLLSLVKTGLAGITSAFYLMESTGKDSNCGGYPASAAVKCRNDGFAPTLAFSSMYALMAYNIVYSSNIMWLDGVILLPLIAAGLRRILNGGRPAMYVITLALAFVSNYYIAYMISIFTLLYFLWYYFSRYSRHRGFATAFVRYAGWSVLAAGMTALLLIPAFMSLRYGKMSPEWHKLVPVPNFSFPDILSKTAIGAYDTITYGLPFVYCGLPVLLFIPYFFARRGITVKKKVLSAAVLGVFLLSMYLSTFNIIWHGMQSAMFFPYRYSFIFCFMLIVLSYQGFAGNLASSSGSACDPAKPLKKAESSYMLIITALLFSIVLLLFFMFRREEYVFLTVKNFIVSTVFLAAYFSIIIAAGRKQKMAGILFLVLVAAELGINGHMLTDRMENEWGYKDRDAYVNFIEEISAITDEIRQNDKSLFYRTEKTFLRSYNDSLSLGTYGTSHYSSYFNTEVNRFLKGIGISSEFYWHGGRGSTVVTDSLLSVKYLLSEGQPGPGYSRQDKAGDHPEEMTEAEKVKAWLNPYALPIAFMSDAAAEGYIPVQGDPFIQQDRLLSCLAGKEYGSVFIEADKVVMVLNNLIKAANTAGGNTAGCTRYVREKNDEEAYIEFIIPREKGTDAPLYAWFASGELKKCSLEVNGDYAGEYFDESDRYPVYIDEGGNSGTVCVKMILSDEYLLLGDYKFAFIDMEKFESAAAELQAGGLELKSFSERRILGSVKAGTGGILTSSIIYDPGWRIFIDGEEARTFRAAGVFLGTDVPAGIHDIEYVYTPPGLFAGAAVSTVSLAAVAVCMLTNAARKKKKEQKALPE